MNFITRLTTIAIVAVSLLTTAFVSTAAAQSAEADQKDGDTPQNELAVDPQDRDSAGDSEDSSEESTDSEASNGKGADENAPGMEQSDDESDSGGEFADMEPVTRRDPRTSAMNVSAGRGGGADVEEKSLDIDRVETPGSDDSDTSCAARSGCTDADLGHRSERKTVEQVINDRRDEVVSCFTEHLDSDASGSVQVRFKIGKTGSVGEADVEGSSFDNESFRSCVTKTVQNWEFPAPRSGEPATINYPFEYSGN